MPDLRMLAVCGLLLLAVALAFGQAVRYEFVNADDDECLYENPHVTHGLTGQAVRWAFTNRLVGNWDPLTWISHLTDWQFYGSNAGGHHLTNILLHAVTAILLFSVLRQMTGRFWPSAIAGGALGNPSAANRIGDLGDRTERRPQRRVLHTDTCADVSHVRHRFSLVRYLVVVVLFALGLMTKPMLITLPCVSLLLDYWPLGAKAATGGRGR